MHRDAIAVGSALLFAVTVGAACSSDPAPPNNPQDWQDSGTAGCAQGQACGGSGGSTPQAGSGGAAGTTAGSGGVAGQPAAGSGGVAGTAGVAGDAGSAGSELPPDYPAGPYGQVMGSILQDFSFQGLLNPLAVNYVADATTLTKISMHDFYNPTKDTSKPRVLRVTESALWCSACQAEAATAESNYKYWNPKGAEFLELVFEDADSNPSVAANLTTWTKTYKFTFPSALDDTLQLGAFFTQSASPFNMIIDLATMKIVYTTEGAIDTGPDNAQFKQVLGL